MHQTLFSLSFHATICKAVRLSVRHADNSLGTAHIDTSTTLHHKPIIFLLQVCHYKLMWRSDCVLQRVEDEEMEKLKQHSIENHSCMAQWVEQLICIPEDAGSNPAGEQIFFLKSILFAYTFFFFLIQAVTWHSNHASMRDLNEIKRTSSGNLTAVIAK